MQTTKVLTTVLFALWFGSHALAQSEPVATPPSTAVPEPPPLPPKVRGEEEPPEVTIYSREGEVIEEYRQNGRLYMVKVTPLEGVAYYYMDLDGDGDLELQPREQPFSPVVPHMWKVRQW